MNELGVNDAAILLVSLGEQEAAEVFKHLTPKEVQKLGETIARMRGVPRERVNQVINRFAEHARAQSLLVEDAGGYVRAVLKRALGEEKAALLIDRILQGSDVSGIESLKWMEPVAVAELLRGEHPQIIAAILVHLEQEHAGAILMHFEERLRGEVAALMQAAVQVGSETLARAQEDVVIAGERMHNLRRAFDLFEQKTQILRLLDFSRQAQGVRIYIGGKPGDATPAAAWADMPDVPDLPDLSDLSDLSIVSAPYTLNGEIVGTLGVIGPTRMPYERMVQIVDITARLLGNALSHKP